MAKEWKRTDRMDGPNKANNDAKLDERAGEPRTTHRTTEVVERAQNPVKRGLGQSNLSVKCEARSSGLAVRKIWVR